MVTKTLIGPEQDFALLLLQANLRRILGEIGPVLIAFLIGSFIGVSIAEWLG